MKAILCVLLLAAVAVFGAEEKKNEKRGLLGLGYGAPLLGHGAGLYGGHGLGLYGGHGLGLYGGHGLSIASAPVISHSVSLPAPVISHGIASAPILDHGLYGGHGYIGGHGLYGGHGLVGAPLLGLGHGWH